MQNALTAAIKADRLPHAVLIEGDKGTGRHTLAKFIAYAAVCGGEDKPCGECRDCRLERAGTHPDIDVYKRQAENVMTSRKSIVSVSLDSTDKEIMEIIDE